MTPARQGYRAGVTGDDPDETRQELREALKLVAGILKETEIPFALAGGYALWARGGPEPEHDVDFVVAEQDRQDAAVALSEHGLQVVQPPEDWLFKVYVDDAMVDVLFRTNSEPLTRELLAQADRLEVESVLMPVLPATTLVEQKLNALEEHACDFAQLLPAVRAVREQVGWDAVRRNTAANPYARAFLFLLERLDVVAPAP